MLFIETSIFTKQIKELVSDEEYRQLQQDLLVQPDKGDVVKNGGGIRKVRCEPYRVCRRVNILRDYPDDKIKIYP